MKTIAYIWRLPAVLWGQVDKMLLNRSDYTYKSIIAFLKQNGYSVSAGALYRYERSTRLHDPIFELMKGSVL
jgi:hypothetical protein